MPRGRPRKKRTSEPKKTRKYRKIKVKGIEDPFEIPAVSISELKPIDGRWNVGVKTHLCKNSPLIAALDKIQQEVLFIAFDDELSFEVWKKENDDLEIVGIW